MWSRVRFPHPAPARCQIDRYGLAFTSELETPRTARRATSQPKDRQGRHRSTHHRAHLLRGRSRCECRRGWWSVGRHPPGTRVAPPPSAGTVPGWAVRSPSAACGMASRPASAQSRRTQAEGARMTSFGLVRAASSTLRRPAASMNLTAERSRMRIDGLLASRCASFDPVTMSSSPLTASRRGPVQQVRRCDVNRRRRVRQLM